MQAYLNELGRVESRGGWALFGRLLLWATRNAAR